MESENLKTKNSDKVKKMLNFLLNLMTIERLSTEDIRRRLSGTPNFVDIVVIIGLSLLMFYLLRLLFQLSSKWKK